MQITGPKIVQLPMELLPLSKPAYNLVALTATTGWA